MASPAPSTSKIACAGNAAAYVIRRFAELAHLPSSPHAERLLYDLGLPSSGGDVDRLGRWLPTRGPLLQQLGLRVVGRRVAFKTPWFLDWVGEGQGFRAAILQTERHRLTGQIGSTVDTTHAVALFGELHGRRTELLVADPYPGHRAIGPVPNTLEAAHRAAKYGAVVLHWTGWS